jgi:membrane protein
LFSLLQLSQVNRTNRLFTTMTLRTALQLVTSAGSKWSVRNVPRLGAALAYYTLLSLAPLLIVVVAIAGLVFDKTTAQAQVLLEVKNLAGESGVRAVQMLISNARQPGSGVFATSVAMVTLLFGASGVFIELRDSLNSIWDAPTPKSSAIRQVIWQRLVSFGMVLALGFLLLVSLIVSTVISILERYFTSLVPLHFAVAGEIVNFVISLVAVAVLFGLIFKFVPDVPIDWREVVIGAVCTALLFSVGKALLALYLTTLGVGSTYGAAGSLVAFVVWVYYSAQIFFFGAILTRVFADSYGPTQAKRKRQQVAQVSALAR